jgi:hypothetical protein
MENPKAMRIIGWMMPLLSIEYKNGIEAEEIHGGMRCYNAHHPYVRTMRKREAAPEFHEWQS